MRRNPSGAIGDQVVDAMTTNETSFFRDAMPFDALRDDILPQLLRSRCTARRVAIWCAACSTGQEPYSIAMLLRESICVVARLGHPHSGERHLAASVGPGHRRRYGDVEIQRGLPPDLRDRFSPRRTAGGGSPTKSVGMVSFFLSTSSTTGPPAADGCRPASQRDGILRGGN